MTVYKIFCDESCHLPHDSSNVMVLGAIHCTSEKAELITRKIKSLRHEHNYKPELKWSKLHKHQWGLYKAIIDLIIDDTDVHFKTTIVHNKNTLDHDSYNAGSHNNFYYKMFYYTLRDFLSEEEEDRHHIYLDYMDTLGSEKSKKLCEILKHKATHVEATIVQSYEAQLIQVCDLFIGAVCYKNRTDIDQTSPIKNQFIDYLEQKICHKLTMGTPPWEEQFNIFSFQPRGGARC